MLIFSEPHRSLRRLPRTAYKGRVLVFFTDCTLNRRPILSSPELAHACVQTWSEIVDQTTVLPIAYVVMPDHIHVVLHGLAPQSDCLLTHYQWKKRSASLINNIRGATGAKVWQHQSYDRVLRAAERRRLPLTHTIRYIWNNPVRHGLVRDLREYPLAGSCMPSSAPLDSGQWWNELCNLIEST